MKVAVITFHAVCNFGANLQALSTTTMLRQLGHEPMLLDYQPPALVARYQKETPSIQYSCHEDFVQEYLPISKRCASMDAVRAVARDFQPDMVLTGSDAVFRILNGGKNLEETDRFPNPFFLTWVDELGVPKGSISASVHGAAYFKLPKAIRRDLSEAFQSFHGISVRDRWSQYMIALLTKGRRWPIRTPDPVLSLEDAFELPSEYESEPKSLAGQYLLLMPALRPRVGCLDDAWVKRFVELAHARDLQVFGLPFPFGESQLKVDRVLHHPMHPLSWYAWIKHSSGYAGTLFHPLVSALGTGVPLVSFDQYMDHRIPWRSKVYDLLLDAKLKQAYVPGRKIEMTHPDQVFDRLMDRKLQARAYPYVTQAKKRFRQHLYDMTSD